MNDVRWGIGTGLGVVVYVTAVVWFMMHAEAWLGPEDGVTAPILGLLLFVFSAAITGLLVFGRPALLALQGDRSAALRTLALTLGVLIDAGLVIVIIRLLFGV